MTAPQATEGYGGPFSGKPTYNRGYLGPQKTTTVNERILGKAEVVSSILTGSTILSVIFGQATAQPG